MMTRVPAFHPVLVAVLYPLSDEVLEGLGLFTNLLLAGSTQGR
jgi:hypothetical protein